MAVDETLGVAGTLPGTFRHQFSLACLRPFPSHEWHFFR